MSTLLNAVTTAGAGTGVQVSTFVGNSFTVSVSAVGAFTALVNVETSVDNSTWTVVKSFSLSGFTSASEGFSGSITNNYYVRGNVLSLSGTTTTITLVNTVVTANANISGTTTNDSATVGSIGEYVYSATPSPATTSTVTITTATPAVVSWAAHGLVAGAAITFTSTVALPTGLTAGVAYYVIPTGLVAGSFQVSATPFGAAIATSAAGSGVNTATAGVSIATATPLSVTAIQLTAGDWDVVGAVTLSTAASTSVTQAIAGISQTNNTLGADGTYARTTITALVPGAVEWLDQVTPATRLSLAATTVVYLIGQSTFTVSTQTAAGFLRARRVR